MREFSSFVAFILIWWCILLTSLFVGGCERQSPLSPTTVETHTADVDPPLPNPYTDYTVQNFPAWACRGKFVRDPGPEFWDECRRRGL